MAVYANVGKVHCVGIAIAAKQAEGWWLEQPEPGVLIWRTPNGRTYASAPTQYAI